MGGRTPVDKNRSTPVKPDLCPKPGPDLMSPVCRECGLLADMLSQGVPISLIMDLCMPRGPHSSELLAAEGTPETAWWGSQATP